MAIAPKDQEIAALYREAGSDGPSAELDRAILQAAHQALAPQVRTTTDWRRWRLHIPVLASLFMVAMFGLLISLNQPDPPNLGQLARNETPPASPARETPPPSGQLPTPAVESRARMTESLAPRAMAKAAIPAQPAESAAPAAVSENLTASAPTAAPSPMAADTATPAMAKAESRAARTAAAPAVIATPKEWLTSIQRLLDESHLDEARSSLAAFEKAYPAETVPEALRRRLKP